MRTILVGIVFIIFFFISIPAYLVSFIIGLFDRELEARFGTYMLKGLGWWVLLVSGVKLTVKGKENILQDGSAMYAFNHRGFYDIPAGYVSGPSFMSFVSKVELKKVFIISIWMMISRCLFLDREDIKKGMQTILEGIELLKGGQSIFIAPEGTRNHGEELLEFHQASFKLAEKSHRPIVPVALNNTDEVFENHLPWIRSTHVIIEYCQPIYMDELERDEKKHVGEMVRQIISDTIKKNAAEL